jgi:hypothetical protein
MTVPPRPKFIEAIWETFEESVISPQAESIQRREMKMAFYAGAEAVMKVLREIDDNISEELGIKVLERLNDELVEFARQVKERG